MLTNVIISLPLVIFIPRKTKEDKLFALNLNNYRNAHHFTMNNAKKIMKEIVERIVEGVIFPDPPYIFSYTIYPESARKFDLGNVAPGIQKFTDDALVELGKIKDDNYKIIQEVHYYFGGIDKENPRADLNIQTRQ